MATGLIALTGASNVVTIDSLQTTAQTLHVPDVTATDTLVTLGLAQTITGVKTMTNPTVAATTATVPSYTVTTGGTLMNTPTAGVQEADSAAFYNTLDTTNGRRYNDSWSYFRLTAPGAGITSIADVFNATGSGIPTVLNGVYEIEWDVFWVHTTTGTGTITWTIVATQNWTNLVADYMQSAAAGIGTAAAPQHAGVQASAAAASIALPASAANTAVANHHAKIHCVVETGTAGNIRLRMTASAGTATPSRDSYFRARRLPALNSGTFAS